MSSWQENMNGNYTYPLRSDGVMTIYSKNGDWRGIYEGRGTRGSFDTPEEAMDIMERAVLYGESHLLKEMDSGWRRDKNGGYYRVSKAGLLSIKQARTGKWYGSISGRLVKDQWFDSAEEAKQYLNEVVSLAIT